MSIFSPLEFLGDGAHATPQLADAGALRVDGGVVGLHGDLGAVAGLARERHDLDESVRDLGNLEREELADESGMRARDRDLRTLRALRDRRHVDAQACTVRVVLGRDLLLGREDRLDRAEVDVDHAGVGSLLHDAGDDVALLAAELAQHGVVGDVAQTLADDLLRGEGGDAAEVLGSRLLFTDDEPVLVAGAG